MVRKSRLARKLGMQVVTAVAAAIVLGIATFAFVSPAHAQEADGQGTVDDVVAAVALLPELSALTPEEHEQLQADLRTALEAAVEGDLAVGADATLSVDDIVAAVQAAAAEADVIDIDQLVAAALDAYQAE